MEDLKKKDKSYIINCPNCNYEIDVNELLSSKLEQEYQKKLEEERKKHKEKVDELVKARIKLEKEKIEKVVEEEQSGRLEEMTRELKEQSEKIRELNKIKAEKERIQREKNELNDRLEAEYEKKLNDILQTEKEKIRQTEKVKQELKIRELEKKLEDQKKLTEEMKRRQEQGSMQLQGEVQELAIEEYLIDKFPVDTIEAIKKGANGADVLQVVNVPDRGECGIIYYESKRTKNYNSNWIDKMKRDMVDMGADIGVLVTQAFPGDLDRMGQVDGIWVCSFQEFKGLCFVLRETLIKINYAVSAQENKGDKMSLLYNYLTSNEFNMQMTNIVEGFMQMQKDINTEKRAFVKQWKKREKQLEKVLVNTTNMIGSIEGIAGNAIMPIKALELTGSQDEEIEEE